MSKFSERRKYVASLLFLVPLLAVTGFGLWTLRQTRQAHAQTSLTVIQNVSFDQYTNDTSQHQTQVEPDTFAFGSTVVSAFQSGRFVLGGGASGIDWVTSFNAGLTWQGGTLPDLTVYNGGSYARASDSVVAYDAAHHTWLISALAAQTTFDGVNGSTAIVISRSSDALHWSNPVVVSASGANNNFDKDWIVCDEHSSSPFYGRCYEEWDDSSNHGRILMSYSADGGLTWSVPQSPATQSFSALGGQPLVQPDGHVIVPIYGYDLATGAESIYSYRSINGGASWTDEVKISPSTYSSASAFYRGGSLPSAEIDKAGKVYLTWAGCYFEPNCPTDDLVLTTTTDGLTWTPIQRIPLDPISSGVEHMTGAIAVDSSTSGSSAHLAVTYYYWPNAGCTASTCQIYVGVATSTNGGATWSKPEAVSKAMHATWWATTDQGYMTGDYTSISISHNQAVTVMPVATAPNGQTLNQYMEGISVTVTGGSLAGETFSASAMTPHASQTTQNAKHYHTAH